MARYYLDTSALVKNYHVEPGTDAVQRVLAEPESEFFISRLGAVEMLSGFAGKVRMGVLSTPDFAILRSRFLADVRNRSLKPVRVLNVDYQTAEVLIGKHAMSRQFRTLDAIQLAVSLRVHRTLPLDHFVCADQRLTDVAIMEGLRVIRP